MKNYLLDTHIVLWMMQNPEKLPDNINSILINTQNNIYISKASLWEIAIKLRIGKLQMTDTLINFRDELDSNNFLWLPIEDEHIFETLDLPLFPEHRDPFDRLIIAQAIKENLILISDDQKFKSYPNLNLLSV